MIHRVYSLLVLSMLMGCVSAGAGRFAAKSPLDAGDVALADGLNHLVTNAPVNPVDYTAWIIAGLGAVGVASAGAVRAIKRKKKPVGLTSGFIHIVPDQKADVSFAQQRREMNDIADRGIAADAEEADPPPGYIRYTPNEDSVDMSEVLARANNGDGDAARQLFEKYGKSALAEEQKLKRERGEPV